MHSEGKAKGALMALLAFGYVFMAFVAFNADSLETMRRLRLNSVEASITRYTRDIGHLPPSLDKLVVSDETGWRGPYSSQFELNGRVGSLRYAIMDAASLHYRLAIAARTLTSGEEIPEAIHERRVYLAGSQ
jgi:hypothetical protein